MGWKGKENVFTIPSLLSLLLPLQNHKEEIEELQKQVLELRIKSRNAVRQAVETSTAGIDLSREELLEHARQGAEKALQETEKSLRQQLEHMAATLESQEQDLQRSRNRCREIEQDEQRARQRCEKLEGRRQELEEVTNTVHLSVLESSPSLYGVS